MHHTRDVLTGTLRLGVSLSAQHLVPFASYLGEFTRDHPGIDLRLRYPLGKAWQALTDFGSYHTWHPILTLESYAGPLAAGTLLQGQSSGGPAGE